MFDIPGSSSIGNIGFRNEESVKQVLKNERIRLVGEHVGGNIARTLTFDSSTGEAKIRAYGLGEFLF